MKNPCKAGERKDSDDKMLKNNSVFTVKVEKMFPGKQGQKGIKAQVALHSGEKLFLEVPFDGELASSFKEGAVITVVGTLRIKKDVKYPILTVQRKLNGGGNMVVIGRLTKDSELKYSQEGLPYAYNSLAVNYGYGDKKETDFYEITVFGNSKDPENNAATSFAKYGEKGRLIAVVGRYSNREFEGKIYSKIIADRITYLEAQKGKEEKTFQSPQAPNYDDWNGIGTEVDEIDF